MQYSFNLIDQPWIPCTTLNGSLVELSLHDLFAQAHELRAICCETPLMTAALYPTLLALLHRVFGPEDREAWELLWKQGAFPMQPLISYFEQWYERFDLFHPERPFYQERDDRVQPKSVIHLVHSIGNTGTLFTHETDENVVSLTSAEAARQLLAAQLFRTAGLSGLVEKFTDGAFTRGVLFWLNGATIFEMLMLNLMPYPSSLLSIPHTTPDSPVWEQEAPYLKRGVPYGYLDYLTWSSNRIMLHPVEEGEQVGVKTMRIAPGLQFSAEITSPQKRYSRKSSDDPWQFLYFNSNKALWRDYHSLLTFGDTNIRPPAVITWLAELLNYGILDARLHAQVTAIGMLADQAKPIFYRQEFVPLPKELLGNPEAVLTMTEAIQDAEAAALVLRSALNELADQVLMRGGDSQQDGETRKQLVQNWDVLSLYWARLEPHFWEFVEAVSKGADQGRDEWRKAMKGIAHDCLTEAARMCGTSAAALKGEVNARRKLNVGISKLFEAQEK